jgi:hypothetical protein
LLYISLSNYDKNHFLTNAEVVAAGKTIYDQQIRQLVETPDNIGKMLALDIETGDYSKRTVAVKNLGVPKHQRVFGQYQGRISMSEDFDAPLPDSFWLGES